MPYFEPTSSERRGLIVLCVALLLALAIGVGSYLAHPGSSSADAPTGDTPGLRRSSRGRAPQYYAVPEREVETFDFDPNTADSTSLLRLGFPAYMVRNIYRYRARGGRYHEADDLRRTYGMTNELWDRIAPHVRIDRRFQYVDPQPRRYPRAESTESGEPSYVRDTLLYPMKLKEGSFVFLNQADTTALKKIPGIGSYYARQIVRYRNELGGYVSLAQLQEIDGMPEGVERWLRLDSVKIRRIDVNHATKTQLVRHPYLRTYRAGAIWDYRHNYGALRGISDLQNLPSFTEADLRRLEPYLEFR